MEINSNQCRHLVCVVIKKMSKIGMGPFNIYMIKCKYSKYNYYCKHSSRNAKPNIAEQMNIQVLVMGK